MSDARGEESLSEHFARVRELCRNLFHKLGRKRSRKLPSRLDFNEGHSDAASSRVELNDSEVGSPKVGNRFRPGVEVLTEELLMKVERNDERSTEDACGV